MKYIPCIVTTMEALEEALKNDASVILVDNQMPREAFALPVRFGYLPMELPIRTGKLFASPDAEDPEVADPRGIL